ncbi:MAG: hypothetical protein Q9188_005652 [Gyalolechia gomerana]
MELLQARQLASFTHDTEPPSARSTAQKSRTVTAEPSDGEAVITTSSPKTQTPFARRPDPSSLESQSTDQPSNSMNAGPIAEKGESSGNSSPKTTPIIIGVVLGVVIASLGIWLTWHYIKRKRRSTMEEAKKDGREVWPPRQDPPPLGNGLGLYGGAILTAVFFAAFNERYVGTFFKVLTEQLRVVPSRRFFAAFRDVRSIIAEA